MSVHLRTHPLRERILAFYRHYCPDKPASHVDYLLDKYAGNEDEVLEILKEKYGPEPIDFAPKNETDRVASVLRSPAAASYLVSQFDGQGAALRHALGAHYGLEPHLRADAKQLFGAQSAQRHGFGSSTVVPMSSSDFETELRIRQAQFQQDMAVVADHEARRAELDTLQAVTEAKMELQRQEVELQQLRLALSSSRAQGAANKAAHDETIKRTAQQLTRAKLRCLSLKSSIDPTRVASGRLEATVAETRQVEEQLQSSVQYCRCLAEVVRRHLRAYPLSPMHGSLRDADPAMCARLEQ